MAGMGCGEDRGEGLGIGICVGMGIGNDKVGRTSAIYDKNPTYSDSRSPPALRPRKFERGPCFRSLRERRSPGEIPFSKSRHALGY